MKKYNMYVDNGEGVFYSEYHSLLKQVLTLLGFKFWERETLAHSVMFSTLHVNVEDAKVINTKLHLLGWKQG